MSQNPAFATVGPPSGQIAEGYIQGADGAPSADALTSRTRLSTYARYATPLGRALFASIFLMSFPEHFSSATIGYAAHAGVPFAGLLVPASGLLALAGGLSVLLGYRARIGAWMLILFLLPVTLMMHNFWTVSDPMMRQMQIAMFMKNFALLGGALVISVLGAGPTSLDARREARAGLAAVRRGA